MMIIMLDIPVIRDSYPSYDGHCVSLQRKVRFAFCMLKLQVGR